MRAASSQEHVPEVKVAARPRPDGAERARGRDDRLLRRQYDVLLSTTIVESGLDIPTANTLIVHRADMFGLAQLYQLRGPRRALQDRAPMPISPSPPKRG